MASPGPLATVAPSLPPTMPAKLDASPLSPEEAHAQLPGADALASAFSGLESATTEWPGLEMWPTAQAALDNGWDEVVAQWPREDVLSKARSAESLAAGAGAPTCGQTCHPSAGRPGPPSRLFLNFTASRAARLSTLLEAGTQTLPTVRAVRARAWPENARMCRHRRGVSKM